MESTTESTDLLKDTQWPLLSILALCAVSAILFTGGLLATEVLGEVGVDVDFKPFFLPYLLITFTRFGPPTLSVGLGAALGEGILDVFEGYELDDPIGFIGYVLGFVVFGWYLHEVADDPSSWRAFTGAAILGAFVQAVFESFAIFIFDPSAGPVQGLLSLVGNTISHGLLLGAIPLFILVPVIQNYIHAHEL